MDKAYTNKCFSIIIKTVREIINNKNMKKVNLILGGILLGVSVASAQNMVAPASSSMMMRRLPMMMDGRDRETGTHTGTSTDIYNRAKEMRNASGTMPIDYMGERKPMPMWASGTRPMMNASDTQMMRDMMRDSKDKNNVMRGIDDPKQSPDAVNMQRPSERMMSAPCVMPEQMPHNNATSTLPPDWNRDQFAASGTQTTMGMPLMMGSSTMPDLKKGDGNRNGKGAMVRMLQDMLVKLGYLNASSTGNFGEMTRQAVVKYQKDMGIANPTGYFGPMTKEKMKTRCGMQNHDMYMQGGMNSSSTLPAMPPMINNQ